MSKRAFTESVAERRPSWFCKLHIRGKVWCDPVHGMPGVSSPRLYKGGTEEAEMPLWRICWGDLYIRWIMCCGIYCRRSFLRSLWSKTFLSAQFCSQWLCCCGLFLKSRRPTPVNRAYWMLPSARFLRMKAGDVKNSKVFCSHWTQSCNSTMAGRRGFPYRRLKLQYALRVIYNRAFRWRMRMVFSKNFSKHGSVWIKGSVMKLYLFRR